MKKNGFSPSRSSALSFSRREQIRPLLKKRFSADLQLDYSKDFWPPIEKFLDAILDEDSAGCRGGIGGGGGVSDDGAGRRRESAGSGFKTASRGCFAEAFESRYRLIYSCVVHSHGEKLAVDLFRKVSHHVKTVSFAAAESDAESDAVEFLLNFYRAEQHLLRVFARIQEIFLYFDRAFLQPKMGFSVETELTNLMKTLLFDFLGDKLLPVLEEFVAAAAERLVDDDDDDSEELVRIFFYVVDKFRRISPELLESYPELTRRFRVAFSNRSARAARVRKSGTREGGPKDVSLDGSSDAARVRDSDAREDGPAEPAPRDGSERESHIRRTRAAELLLEGGTREEAERGGPTDPSPILRTFGKEVFVSGVITPEREPEAESEAEPPSESTPRVANLRRGSPWDALRDGLRDAPRDVPRDSSGVELGDATRAGDDVVDVNNNNDQVSSCGDEYNANDDDENDASRFDGVGGGE